ncbi:MAG: hypothetical protein KGO96_10845 [Elusimicrobia bacterium]|nr:hypothetical protein [Elusimicrobiota bacterium]MDE2426389.1 hypothetical protein [Elusimicrobiota bacterium]
MPPDKGPLDDLQLATRLLDDLNIRHALIGGWAVVAWGVVRATQDLDFLVLADATAKTLLSKEFRKQGYKVEHRKGDSDDPIPEIFRLTPPTMGERPTIDILPACRSFEADAIGRSVRLRLGAWDLPVLRREDLIAMKLLAGGGIDFEDARQLLEIHAGRINEELLLLSCSQLKVHKELALIRKRIK